jgi:hypothetical protein
MCSFSHKAAGYDLKPCVGSILSFGRFAGELILPCAPPGVDVQTADDGRYRNRDRAFQDVDKNQGSSRRKALPDSQRPVGSPP